MNTAPASSALQKLRAKTDRELALLIRREVKRGMALVSQGRPCEARQSYQTADALLAMSELCLSDRVRLLQELGQLRESLAERAMSAA